MSIKGKLKSKSFWAAVLGAAGGFLADKLPLADAIREILKGLSN